MTEPPATRRGLIGPFTGRQLGTVALIVVIAAVLLVVVTRPIGPGSGTGAGSGTGVGSTPLPVATPFLVGSAREGLQVGAMAPELTWTNGDGTPAGLQDLNGAPIRLADLRGKVVWLNFWATWCPPCQGETPVLRDIDDQYRDKGLVVVGVAVQETAPDVVRGYAATYGLGYPIGFDATANVFDLYRVFALPTQYFIGPDGRILKVVNGPLDVPTLQTWLNGWLPRS